MNWRDTVGALWGAASTSISPLQRKASTKPCCRAWREGGGCQSETVFVQRSGAARGGVFCKIRFVRQSVRPSLCSLDGGGGANSVNGKRQRLLCAYCTSGNDANKDRFMEWKRDSGGGGNEARAAFRFGLETNTNAWMDD